MATVMPPSLPEVADRGKEIRMDILNVTIPEMLEFASVKWPDNDAVVCGDQRITFAQLKELAGIAARGLYSAGVRPGDHVGFIISNCLEFVWLQYGVCSIGAKVVPINVSLKAHEIKQIVKSADISTLIIMDRFRKVDYLAILGQMVPDYQQYEPGKVDDASLPKLRNVIIFNSSGSRDSNAFTVYDVMELGKDSQKGISPQKSDSADYAYVMFTSGTTAFPKAAMQTHRGIVGGGFYYGEALNLSSHDKYLCFSPFFHVGGLVSGLSSCCMHGTALHLMPFFEATEAAQIIARERITAAWGLGVMFRGIIDSARKLGLDISSLKKAVIPTGGNTLEKLGEELGLDIATNAYAMTEGEIVSITMPDEPDWSKRRNSAGRPLPGIEVRIVDNETKVPLGIGEIGEICFRGWNNILGYYNLPVETAAAIDKEGFFHTEDIGMLDKEGYLYWRGRYKQVVKTGGENVSQIEVEMFLEDKTPWIKKAGVVGVPDRRWGEAVTALVELKPGSVVTGQEIQDYLKGKIADFKIPKHFLFIEKHEWPLRPTKKLDKEKLREIAIARLGSH